MKIIAQIATQVTHLTLLSLALGAGGCGRVEPASSAATSSQSSTVLAPALTHEQAEVLHGAIDDVLRKTVPMLPRTASRAELRIALNDLTRGLAGEPVAALNERITRVASVLAQVAYEPADSPQIHTIQLLLVRMRSVINQTREP